MSTATIAPESENQLSKPDTSILFMARRQDLRLIKRPRYAVRNQGGEAIDQTPGEAIQFVDGRFFCPTEGEVALDNGRMVDAAEILTWLEKHRLNGHVEEGFWRVDPVAPPPSEAEFSALMDAATNFDEDRLAQLVAEEREGWNREALINTGERAIARIQEIKAKAIAEAEAKAAGEGSTPPTAPAAPSLTPEEQAAAELQAAATRTGTEPAE